MRSNKKSIFAFIDDEIDDEPNSQMDAVLCELNNYKNVRLLATQKKQTNV